MVSELSPNCRSVNMVFVANWLQSELIDTFQFWSLSQEDHPKSLPKGRWSTKKERIDHYFQSIKKYRVPNIKICTFGKPCIWVTSSPIFKIFSSICYKNSCCHCCSTSHSLRLSRCCKEHKKDKIKCAFRTLRKKISAIVWNSLNIIFIVVAMRFIYFQDSLFSTAAFAAAPLPDVVPPGEIKSRTTTPSTAMKTPFVGFVVVIL